MSHSMSAEIYLNLIDGVTFQELTTSIGNVKSCSCRRKKFSPLSSNPMLSHSWRKFTHHLNAVGNLSRKTLETTFWLHVFKKISLPSNIHLKTPTFGNASSHCMAFTQRYKRSKASRHIKHEKKKWEGKRLHYQKRKLKTSKLDFNFFFGLVSFTLVCHPFRRTFFKEPFTVLHPQNGFKKKFKRLENVFYFYFFRCLLV